MGDKLLLFDFRCTSCDEKFDALVKSEQRTHTCPACGGEAKRLISTPRIALDGCDPSFPGAYSKWAKVREQRTKQDRKRREDHGE